MKKTISIEIEPTTTFTANSDGLTIHEANGDYSYRAEFVLRNPEGLFEAIQNDQPLTERVEGPTVTVYLQKRYGNWEASFSSSSFSASTPESMDRISGLLEAAKAKLARYQLIANRRNAVAEGGEEANIDDAI